MSRNKKKRYGTVEPFVIFGKFVEPPSHSSAQMTRWNFLMRGFALCTLVALCFTANAYLNYSFQGYDSSWTTLLSWELPSWYLWGLLFPLILWLARRYPLHRGQWYIHLPLHVLFALFLSLTHLSLHVAISHLVDRVLMNYNYSFSEVFTSNFFSRFTWRAMIYFVVLAICHAVDWQQRYRTEQQRSSTLSAQLVGAQLQALKMNLHPHFLFNTLQSISELMHRDIKAADEMIVRLGDLLRHTLETSAKEEVTLKDEMKFLDAYLSIQKIRFGDRLHVEIELDPDTEKALLPNLILQPVVENAIRHGIAPHSGPGTLKITSYRVEGALRITVSDSGSGLDPTVPAEQYFKKGFGLRNTRDRLRQLYGSKFQIELNSTQGDGLIVVIELPLRFVDSDNSNRS